MLGSVDFDHPIFAPFREPQFADFTKIQFWRHRSLGLGEIPGACVLARFDNGDPALTEFQVEKGSVFALTSSWDLKDSQLALSTKFVPLLHGLLQYGQSGRGALHQLRVLDPVSLRERLETDDENHAGPIRVLKPNGDTMEVVSESFVEADEPGIYHASLSDSQFAFAVNLCDDESQTEPLSADELGRFGVRLAEEDEIESSEALAVRSRQQLATEIENRQKIWQWLAAGALGLVIAETCLAGFLSRRNRIGSQETT
jgi:hypothetical protein